MKRHQVLYFITLHIILQNNLMYAGGNGQVELRAMIQQVIEDQKGFIEKVPWKTLLFIFSVSGGCLLYKKYGPANLKSLETLLKNPISEYFKNNFFKIDQNFNKGAKNIQDLLKKTDNNTNKIIIQADKLKNDSVTVQNEHKKQTQNFSKHIGDVLTIVSERYDQCFFIMSHDGMKLIKNIQLKVNRQNKNLVHYKELINSQHVNLQNTINQSFEEINQQSDNNNKKHFENLNLLKEDLLKLKDPIENLDRVTTGLSEQFHILHDKVNTLELNNSKTGSSLKNIESQLNIFDNTVKETKDTLQGVTNNVESLEGKLTNIEKKLKIFGFDRIPGSKIYPAGSEHQ